MEEVIKCLRKYRVKILIIGIILLFLSVILFICPKIIYCIKLDFFDLNTLLINYPLLENLSSYVLLLISLILILAFAFLKEEKLIIIASDDVYNNDDVELKKYKKQKLLLEISNNDKNILVSALKKMYEFYVTNIDKIDNKCLILIICSLPLVVKLGYWIGDCQNNLRYLHYFRDKKKCLELKSMNKNSFSFDFKVEYTDNKSNELFVGVQSSYIINKYSLPEKFINKNILLISSSNIGIDSIDNLAVLDKFANFIINTIRKYYEKNNVIHISFATSTLVAFCFGRLISKNIDKKIICYQYINQGNNNRPWGIYINGNDDSYKEQVIFM